MYTIALDGCVEVQRALFPPVEISLVAQTVIAWTPDLHHHQQSLFVQLLLIASNSAKCFIFPYSWS